MCKRTDALMGPYHYLMILQYCKKLQETFWINHRHWKVLTHNHTCVYVCAWEWVCACVMYGFSWVCACVFIYIYICKYACTHIYIHTYKHTFIHVFMNSSNICVAVSKYICICVCLRTYKWTFKLLWFSII